MRTDLLDYRPSADVDPMKICLNLRQDSWDEVKALAGACESGGIDGLALVDSPLNDRDIYLSSAAAATCTSTLRLMTAVTNPVSRHPSVTASALLQVAELAPDRFTLGIATGDSALWSIGLSPARVSTLRDYILVLKGLLRGEEVTWRGHTFRGNWQQWTPPVEVPIIVAGSGPRVIEMAAQVADGLILSVGYAPEDIERALERIHAACAAVGRDPDRLEIWWYTELTFADSARTAMDNTLGWFAQWVALGDMNAKGVPAEHQPALGELHHLAQDPGSYMSSQRGRVLVERAKALGVHDWLMAHSARLGGTAADIAARMVELERLGVHNWLLFPDGNQQSTGDLVERVGNELLPALA